MIRENTESNIEYAVQFLESETPDSSASLELIKVEVDPEVIPTPETVVEQAVIPQDKKKLQDSLDRYTLMLFITRAIKFYLEGLQSCEYKEARCTKDEVQAMVDLINNALKMYFENTEVPVEE